MPSIRWFSSVPSCFLTSLSSFLLTRTQQALRHLFSAICLAAKLCQNLADMYRRMRLDYLSHSPNSPFPVAPQDAGKDRYTRNFLILSLNYHLIMHQYYIEQQKSSKNPFSFFKTSNGFSEQNFCLLSFIYSFS